MKMFEYSDTLGSINLAIPALVRVGLNQWGGIKLKIMVQYGIFLKLDLKPYSSPVHIRVAIGN